MTRKQAKALRDFARWVIERGAWDWSGLDSDDIQLKAEKLGLIVRVPFDPEKHDGEGAEFCEPGDDWFEIAPMLRRGKRK